MDEANEGPDGAKLKRPLEDGGPSGGEGKVKRRARIEFLERDSDEGEFVPFTQPNPERQPTPPPCSPSDQGLDVEVKRGRGPGDCLNWDSDDGEFEPFSQANPDRQPSPLPAVFARKSKAPKRKCVAKNAGKVKKSSKKKGKSLGTFFCFLYCLFFCCFDIVK
jgi:hypothetical protein